MGERECQTCRWWNTAGDYVSSYSTSKTFPCERIHATGSPGHRKARVFPVGDAYLSTRPDFGCALHEPFPTPSPASLADTPQRTGEG